MPSLDKINYHHWPNSYQLSNALVDLVITTDIGPRIIRYGFREEENEFFEDAQTLGQTNGKDWHGYGGHRLWHAPEVMPRTYFPDNQPVKLEQHPDFIRIIQPIEGNTGIQKELDIRLSPQEADVQVIHRLYNRNLWKVELAPWALSMMAPGGTAILPLPPRGSHIGNLLPTCTLALWPYTNMTDPRYTWGSKYILVRQAPDRIEPQKIGLMNLNGWVGYARNGHLFITTFSYQPGKIYTDLGNSVEIFTNQEMLEVETFAPLTQLEPDQSVEHTETWCLHRDIHQPSRDADVETHILPLLR